MSENIGREKALKQTIHCAHLKCFLDPEVEEDIVDKVEELENRGSECGNANDIAMNKRQLMEKASVTVWTMK